MRLPGATDHERVTPTTSATNSSDPMDAVDPVDPAGAGAGAVRQALSSEPVRRVVVVAAGMGSRLQGESDLPKPLVPLVGVPLAARVLAAARKAGCTHATVVTGYRAELVQSELARWAPPGLALDFVHNERFREPNGVSLAAAARVQQEPFALLMSDHLFAPERLAAAAAEFAATGRSLLVVEDRARFHGDLSDATKVRTEGGRIVAITKELESYDAIDTGLFVLAPADLGRAIEAAGPAPSISDIMRALAERGELAALPLRQGWWHDVDTPADARAAEALLFESLRKPTDGFMARHVHRPISLFLTQRLWRLGIGPNTVTTGTLALGLAAGWAFAGGADPFHGLLGATLFQLQSIVDGTDGELARLLHKESRFGFWFDVTVDNVTHAAVFAGLAAGQIASGVPGPWLWLGAAAVLGVAACFALLAPLMAPRAPVAPKPRMAPAFSGGGPSAAPEGGGAGTILRSLVDGLSRRGFTWLLFPCALFGWLGAFLWLAALGSAAYALAVLVLRVSGSFRR